MKILKTLNLLLNLALACLLPRINGTVSLQPVLTGPDKAFLGTSVTFYCTAPATSPRVTYELVKDGDVVVDTEIALDENQTVPFRQKVSASTEGSYHCKATAGGNTAVSNSIRLSVVTPPLNTRVTSEPFPPVAFEGSRFVLSCTVTKGSHLSYSWFFNRKKVTPSSSASLHPSGNKLVIEEVTPQHAGSYSCMAWSTVQDTRYSSSPEVQLTVKAYVSKPRITFSITKEGDDYHGKVTCWSTQGSLPVNFSLSLDDREVRSTTATQSLTASFPVTIVPKLDMGVARCRVTNEVQELTSEPLTLVVVPVGGKVSVDVEYLYGADSELAAARLSCHVSKGTFPHVSWLFNDSILPSEMHEDTRNHSVLSNYAMANHSRTLFLTQLGPKESGFYRCRARDSYDAAGPWVESADVLVQVTDKVLNSTPATTSSTETAPNSSAMTVEIFAIVFCCFLLLMLAVGVGCVYLMFDRHQAHNHVGPSQSDTPPLSQPTRASAHTEKDYFSAESDDQDQIVEVTV